MTEQKDFATWAGIEWTADDESLEAWCLEHGFEPSNLTYRVRANNQARWDKYVEDIKTYALSLDDPEELCCWHGRVEPPYDYKKNWALMPNGRVCVAG